MIRNFFKPAWRNLQKNKWAAAINILGLGVSFAACLLIGLYVYNERSFDEDVPGNTNIYRLNEYMHYDGANPQVSAATGPPLAPFLKEHHSEIASFTRVFPVKEVYDYATVEYNGERFSAKDFVCTDTSFISFWGIPVINGPQNGLLQKSTDLVLTKSFAEKIFGNKDPLNSTVKVHTRDTSLLMHIAAIIPDFSQTTHLRASGLMPVPRPYIYDDNYGVILGPTYLKLRPDVKIGTLEAAFTETIHLKNKWIDARLQPLKEIHTGSMVVNYDKLNYKRSDGAYTKAFIIMAIAIFIVACINYINLTVSISGYRGKEIAMRRISGAGSDDIIGLVFAEMLISVFGALVFALLISTLALPAINRFFDRAIPFDHFFKKSMLVIYLVAWLAVSVLAAAYPAVLMLSVKTTSILRRKLLIGNSKANLRSVLVTGQFVIAVVFITCVIGFFKQMQFIRDKNLGFSYSQVLNIPINTKTAEKIPVVRSQLLQINGVEDVATGFVDLGDNSGSLFGVDYLSPKGTTERISANMENVSPNYPDFFSLQFKNGKSFDKSSHENQYIINEAMVAVMGYKDPVGKTLNMPGFNGGRVIGVVKNFNYQSLHAKIDPLVIVATDMIPQWKTQLYIRIKAGEIQTSINKILTVLKENNPDQLPEYQFLDAHFQQVYQAEKQAGGIVSLVGGLAILITCLGLLGLTSFTLLKRTKEIGIRKILGATTERISLLLTKSFLIPVLIALIIAIPVSYLVMNQWLQSFEYRTTLHWWIFVTAGVIALCIAAITISVQVVKAATANPATSLRNE